MILASNNIVHFILLLAQSGLSLIYIADR